MRLAVRQPQVEPPATSADVFVHPETFALLGAADGGPVLIAGRKRTVATARANEQVPPGQVVLPAGVRRNAGAGPGDIVEAAVERLPRLARLDLRPQGIDPPPPERCREALGGAFVAQGDTRIVDVGGRLVEVFVAAAEPRAGRVDGAAFEKPASSPPRPGAGSGPPPMPAPEQPPTEPPPILAGLESQVRALTGWLRILTDPGREAWTVPAPAGVMVVGPEGSGAEELVSWAAAQVRARLTDISFELTVTPRGMLDRLEQAIAAATPPCVFHVRHLGRLVGTSGGTPRAEAEAFRAPLHWFAQRIAERPGFAGVLSATDAGSLAGFEGAAFPYRLVIDPPDTVRRERLLRELLRGVQVDANDLDPAAIATKTAGFSGADLRAAVLTALADATGKAEPMSTAMLLAAAAQITPSSGEVTAAQLGGIGFAGVAGMREVKEKLTEAVIWPRQNPEGFARLKVDPPRGILLYGPPGTGKTFVVRALAVESGLALFTVKGPELLDRWVGASEAAVRDLFARAMAAKGSIIFFDEFDALAPIRGRSTSTVSDQVVAALLTELDGLEKRGETWVIAATNRPDLIDPALLRAGRFELHIEIGMPDLETRRALLTINGTPYAEDVDLDALAARLDGRSSAEIAGLSRAAALAALRRDRDAPAVTAADMEAAITSLPSIR